MRLTARALNRATLRRQLLLQRASLDIAEAVRRVLALQAQQAASPYIALWNRVAGFDPVDVDTAFASRTVVKATLMRLTLHAVHVDDYPPLREALHPTLRAARIADRFTAAGLSARDVDGLVSDLQGFVDRPRSVAAISAWLQERLGEPSPDVWWALRAYAPMWHAPTGGPWSFGPRPSYVAPTTRPVLADREAADRSVQVLVRRYLEAFGPASAADVAQFAMVARTRVKQALSALASQLDRFEGPDGVDLYDVAGAPRAEEDAPAPPRLMAMWDSSLLAYVDRSRIIPPDYRKLVIRSNGDVLATLLVDGYVAGVWRPVEGGLEATAFHRLSDEAWEGLAAEARSMAAMLADREPTVYRRYHNWWTALPSAEVRVLPAS